MEVWFSDWLDCGFGRLLGREEKKERKEHILIVEESFIGLKCPQHKLIINHKSL